MGHTQCSGTSTSRRRVAKLEEKTQKRQNLEAAARAADNKATAAQEEACWRQLENGWEIHLMSRQPMSEEDIVSAILLGEEILQAFEAGFEAGIAAEKLRRRCEKRHPKRRCRP